MNGGHRTVDTQMRERERERELERASERIRSKTSVRIIHGSTLTLLLHKLFHICLRFSNYSDKQNEMSDQTSERESVTDYIQDIYSYYVIYKIT